MMATFGVFVLGVVTLSSLPGLISCSSISLFKEWNKQELLREDPEVRMNATELITSKGFPCENYWVTTQDGYILNLLRIPHGRNNSHIPGPKPVVVLQHGLLGSCTHFLTNLVNESLAYILADAGADVWLSNSRGNFYSCNHTSLSPKQEEFWKFSFDEMGHYDLPAVINFVVAKSGVQQVFYVGHSQGTTIGFIGFGENQDLASKIKTFIALAPVADVGNTESALKYLAPFAREFELFLDLFGHGEFNVNPTIMRLIAESLCDKWGSVLCENFLFLLCGFNYKSLNTSRIPVYIAHNPSSTSAQDILHWAQGVISKQFQHFDYGSAAKNMQHYNQSSPPLYDPRKVKVPVAIFRGGKDLLADPQDVSWLLPQLNVILDVNIDYYEHLDFIWATDAPTVIYKKLLAVIFK